MLILGLILVTGVVLAGGDWLARRAHGSDGAREALLVGVTLFLLTVAPLVLILGIYGFALGCDERCDGDGWRGDNDAWQWQAQGLLAVGGVFLSLMALVAAFLRRNRSSLRLLAVAVVLLCAWAAMYRYSGYYR